MEGRMSRDPQTRQVGDGPKNWNRSKVLRSIRSIWYYIGQDHEGQLFRGEAEIDLRGTLVPPHSTAPTTKSPGGLSAVARVGWGRIPAALRRRLPRQATTQERRRPEVLLPAVVSRQDRLVHHEPREPFRTGEIVQRQ